MLLNLIVFKFAPGILKFLDAWWMSFFVFFYFQLWIYIHQKKKQKKKLIHTSESDINTVAEELVSSESEIISIFISTSC